MKHIKKFNEMNSTPEFHSAGDIVHWLDENYPELRQYRNEDASYDDVWYEIPLEEFVSITGLNRQHIRDINDNMEQYEGSIRIYPDGDSEKVTIIGGA